ncbi:hypothetical protein TRSC58_07590 [Trypanosoma rangeli SC58]|uniref:Uncharacterized protein n=1 Tax=Trypanosoma rangeli SC58 TaxID=429131 RepID=A0A061ISJ7_TRYRA|nr:hypothetical protein TRSC58_07590 [Trypanosoma rangeli SC58]
MPACYFAWERKRKTRTKRCYCTPNLLSLSLILPFPFFFPLSLWLQSFEKSTGREGGQAGRQSVRRNTGVLLLFIPKDFSRKAVWEGT